MKIRIFWGGSVKSEMTMIHSKDSVEIESPLFNGKVQFIFTEKLKRKGLRRQNFGFSLENLNHLGS